MLNPKLFFKIGERMQAANNQTQVKRKSVRNDVGIMRERERERVKKHPKIKML